MGNLGKTGRAQRARRKREAMVEPQFCRPGTNNCRIWVAGAVVDTLYRHGRACAWIRITGQNPCCIPSIAPAATYGIEAQGLAHFVDCGWGGCGWVRHPEEGGVSQNAVFPMVPAKKNIIACRRPKWRSARVVVVAGDDRQAVAPVRKRTPRRRVEGVWPGGWQVALGQPPPSHPTPVGGVGTACGRGGACALLAAAGGLRFAVWTGIGRLGVAEEGAGAAALAACDSEGGAARRRLGAGAGAG
eukprot:gene11392-biopygen19882